jgi:uncharacterized protein YggE
MIRLRFLVPVLVAASVLGLAGVPAARAQEPPAHIEVRGQGTVTAKPDVAILGIGASVRRDTATDAFNHAEQLVSALTDALKADGVADKDIQTRQFSLAPEFGRSSDDSPPPVVGWRAVHTLTVKLRDFSTIGKTIDDAVTALGGEALIQGISFSIENTDALASQARQQAIQDAKAKAQELAQAAGVQLGTILAIEETSAPPPTPVAERAAAPAVTGALPAAQISPGELTITVTVQVTFAIG